MTGGRPGSEADCTWLRAGTRMRPAVQKVTRRRSRGGIGGLRPTGRAGLQRSARGVAIDLGRRDKGCP
jgi:hypothetical protein